MIRMRIGRDGERPGAFCGSCGRRIGNAFGPDSGGFYGVALDATWHVEDGRVWRKSRYRGRRPPGSVQSFDTVACPCGVLLGPPKMLPPYG
jgi:hypothetical protein